MDYGRYGDTIILRLDPGEDIVEQVRRVAEAESVPLAEINGLGAVNDFTVGVFDVAEKQFHSRRFRGAYEVTSLHGTITEGNNLHLHMSAANLEGEVRGGHLVSATISATAEIVMRVLDGRVGRRFDEAQGLNLLSFADRPAHE